MNAAIEKLKKEMEENATDAYYTAIGEYLIDLVKNHEIVADKIIDETKNIEGAIKAMEDEARKTMIRKGNVGTGLVSDQDGFNIIKAYFGIDEAELLKKDNVSVLDFDLNSFMWGVVWMMKKY